MNSDFHTYMMSDPVVSMEIEELCVLHDQGRLEEETASRVAQWVDYVAAHGGMKPDVHPSSATSLIGITAPRKPSYDDIKRVTEELSVKRGVRATCPALEPGVLFSQRRVVFSVPVLTDDEKRAGRDVMRIFGPNAKVLTVLEGVSQSDFEQWASAVGREQSAPEPEVPVAVLEARERPAYHKASARSFDSQYSQQMRLAI